MRIALLSPFPPIKGGIARFSSRLSAAFEAAGHEVLPVPFASLYPRWLLKGRSPVDPGATLPESPASGLSLVNPASWASAALALRRRDPDVLVIAYWSALLAPLCAAMRLMSGLKTVVLLHNFASHERLPGEPLLRRLMTATADGAIALSRSVAREFEAAAPKAPVAALFHPVSGQPEPLPSKTDARRRLGLPEASRVLLFFGYVREYKGLDLLLEAMAAVAGRDPSVRLVVAGEFIVDAAPFMSLAERLGVAGCVDIRPGYVPEERVATFMAAADAVVLPYRSATQSGVVPLAFGFGVPVIACDAGALADQVEHRRSGWIVEGQGAGALADGIIGFFREERSTDWSCGIDDVLRTNGWEAFAEKAGGFLQHIAGGE